jgi:muramoyltetrapeptide carboxypeptidase
MEAFYLVICRGLLMKKPRRLEMGDTIGVIAPAGAVYTEENIIKGVKVLENLGFKVVLGNSCSLKYGYLAGKDHFRVEDVNEFFLDKRINAIFCLRGGYGSARIIDEIDYEVIRNNPKIFLGYSDITALHSAIYKKCELITFHGPMVASDIGSNDEYTITNMIDCLTGSLTKKHFDLNPLVKGDVKGEIIGGNLSLLCSLLKTNYEFDYCNKILFLEDIGEEPYSIDRMLQQLKLSGVFRKVKGVVLGQFTNCEPEDKEKSLSLKDLINEFFSSMKIPVYSGLPAGHDSSKITIPVGVKIKINENKMYFTEEGVQ